MNFESSLVLIWFMFVVFRLASLHEGLRGFSKVKAYQVLIFLLLCISLSARSIFILAAPDVDTPRAIWTPIDEPPSDVAPAELNADPLLPLPRLDEDRG